MDFYRGDILWDFNKVEKNEIRKKLVLKMEREHEELKRRLVEKFKTQIRNEKDLKIVRQGRTFKCVLDVQPPEGLISKLAIDE